MSKQEKGAKATACQNDTSQSTKPPSRPQRKTAKSAFKLHKSPKIGTKAFVELQKAWYRRLKEEGFKDLERPRRDGNMDGWLHGQSLRDIANNYAPETQLYYERLRAYLTHRPHWHEDAFFRLAGRLHAKGLSYREICEIARAKGLKPNANKWHVHQAIKALRPLAERWNRTSTKGCDYEPDLSARPGTKLAEEQD